MSAAFLRIVYKVCRVKKNLNIAKFEFITLYKEKCFTKKHKKVLFKIKYYVLKYIIT